MYRMDSNYTANKDESDALATPPGTSGTSFKVGRNSSAATLRASISSPSFPDKNVYKVKSEPPGYVLIIRLLFQKIFYYWHSY